jgi:TRAP-type C4-dicarboxylate transport system permease small subunit
MGINISEQALPRLIGRITYLLSILGGSLMVILSLATAYGVIRRYLFNSPEPYSYEVGCICMLSSFVLTLAAVEWRDRFIRVDIVLTLFPKRFAGIVANLISPMIGLVLVVVFIWQSGIDASHAFQINQKSMSIWREPLYPIKFVIFIGYVLLGLTLLARIYYSLTALRSREKTEETKIQK